MATIPFDRLPRAQAGVLFGRSAQLDDLVQRLRRRENTCVWGPAGFGKTALAAEALLQVVGETEEARARSPFPDGVVVLDLCRLTANQDQAWHLLADKLDPAVPAQLPAADRAKRACKGRQALVVVEGAEEARDGQTLRNLLSVLDDATRQLILTRSTAQAYHPRPIHLDAELGQDDAIGLLEKLTDQRVDHTILAGVAEAIGGHPLALTWSGCQLALGEEPPKRFVAQMQRHHLPGLHEPGHESHTLKWLYDRSVRMLGDDARRVLCAAGLLAAAPFGLGVAVAALEQNAEDAGTNLEERACEALRQLVRHALLRLVGNEELWEFSHALAGRFAREEADLACPPLEPLYRWALTTLQKEADHVRETGEFSRLGNAALHATALLARDGAGDAGAPLGDWLLYDGQDLFFALGRLASARDSLTAVEAWMRRMPRARGAEPSWRHKCSVLLNRKGDVQLAQGDLAAARDSYQGSRQINDELVTGDPTNPLWQLDLSVSLTNLGNVQWAQGDLAAARDSYEGSRQIREKLAASDPTNVRWQHDLGASHCFVGIAQQGQGDLAGAVVSYTTYRDIMEKLARSDSTHVEWQRDLSISLNKLGDLELVQSHLGAARDFYENGRHIFERLAAGDPTNTQWQHDLGNSNEKIGDVLLAQGDLNGALDAYQKKHEIITRLAAGDPTNAQWQHDLGSSNERIGNVLLGQGDLKGALDAYQKKYEIITRLAAGDPTNALWQRDLVVSHVRLGEVAARAGDQASAHREFTDGLTIMERLRRLDPTNAGWRKDAQWLHGRLQR